MNKIQLYHYSNRDIKKIKPLYFGNNLYTFNDKKACTIKRTFFYINKKFSECYFKNSKYLYIVNVYKKNLYNLQIDKLNLKKKYNGNINGLLSYCKKHYKGIIYNIGFDVVCLFKTIKAYKQIIR